MAGIFHGGLGAVIEGVSGESDLYPFFAKHSGLSDLLFRGNDGHEHDALHLQLPAAVGESLGVVACAGADDPFFQVFLGEGAHHVIGSPEFVGADDLEIFPLQPNLAVVFPGEPVIVLQGRARDHLTKAFRGFLEIECDLCPLYHGAHFTSSRSLPVRGEANRRGSGFDVVFIYAWFSGRRLRTVLPACHISLSRSSFSSSSSLAR